MLGFLFRFLKLLGSSLKPRRPHKPTRQPWQPPVSAARPLQAKTNRILEGRCHVIDRDTIVIDNTHVRLAGIDAPEIDHPYGKKAKFALIALCKGKCVKAILTDDMTYERVVAKCLLPDGTDLSAALVAQGLALDWAKFSGGAYRHLEPQGVRKKLWRVDAKHKGRLKMDA